MALQNAFGNIALDATVAETHKAEDTASVSGDKGVPALAVRNDAGGTLVDASGDYAHLQLDASGRLRTSTDPAVPTAVTGTITANGQNVTITGLTAAVSCVSVAIWGTFSTTLVWECSHDGTIWFPTTGSRVDSATTSTGPTLNSTSTLWNVASNGASQFRARCSAYTSGTQNIRIAPVVGLSPQSTLTTLMGNVTLASNVPLPATRTNFRLVSAATTNGTVIKASSARIYAYSISNAAATAKWVKLHNSTTVTPGTTAVAWSVLVPAGQTVAFDEAGGILLGTGLCLSITGAGADNDTTAVAAGDVHVHLTYI